MKDLIQTGNDGKSKGGVENFTLRVPEEVFEWIKNQAKSLGVSVNAYIIHILSKVG